MRLRTRLIIAFLLISVIPLAVVTGYGYYSSRQAMRRAVQAEAGVLAAELGRRMELVTSGLERRVDGLWDVPVRAKAEAVEPAQEDTADVPMAVASFLGDAAAFLDRIEIVPEVKAAGTAPAADAETATRATEAATSRDAPSRPPRPAAPAVPPPPDTSVPPAPPAPPAPIVVDVSRLLAEATKDDLEAKHVTEMARRWLEQAQIDLNPAVEAGIRAAAEGLKLGAAEIERAAQERRRLIVERKGSHLGFRVVRDGEVVGHVNAKLNFRRVFDSVLTLSQREQGEIPFAIDPDQNLYAPTPADRTTLERLNLTAAGASTAADEPWVVVTREDPSGVRFGIARPIGASLAEIRRAALRNLGLGLVVIFIALAGVFPLSTHMTRNLSTLTEGVHQIARGDLQTRVPVRSRDEFGQLAQAFNKMTEDLESHQALLVQQERLQRELELCRQIQNDMLPHESLRLGLTEVKGVSIPAREVGGDFFNYFLLPDGQMALLVGDVSGKGVGAALLMANIQATLRARLPLEQDLAPLADAIDRDVEGSTPRGVYLTLFVGILDPQGKTLRYVNAGHNPQFVLRPTGGLERLTGTGLPIGLFAGHGYEERRIQLEDDDLLFFYTDGMVETENERGDMFGAERLESLILEGRTQRVEDLLARIEGAVRDFRGTAEPFDDATMMALRLGGREPAEA